MIIHSPSPTPRDCGSRQRCLGAYCLMVPNVQTMGMRITLGAPLGKRHLRNAVTPASSSNEWPALLVTRTESTEPLGSTVISKRPEPCKCCAFAFSGYAGRSYETG